MSTTAREQESTASTRFSIGDRSSLLVETEIGNHLIPNEASLDESFTTDTITES